MFLSSRVCYRDCVETLDVIINFELIVVTAQVAEVSASLYSTLSGSRGVI